METQNGRELLISILNNYTSEAYDARKNQLRTLFEEYHSITDPELTEILERAVELHKNKCIRERNETYMRQHNTFVMRYLSKHPPKNRDIAGQQNMCMRQVYRDIEDALERMMIFVYGIDGVKFFESGSNTAQPPPGDLQ